VSEDSHWRHWPALNCFSLLDRYLFENDSWSVWTLKNWPSMHGYCQCNPRQNSSPALYSYQSFLSARKFVGICIIAKSTVGCVAFETSTVLLVALPSPCTLIIHPSPWHAINPSRKFWMRFCTFFCFLAESCFFFWRLFWEYCLERYVKISP